MKNKRQTKIIELVTTYDIGTQEELADRLSNAGFNVTQATVSRDIRELKLSKVNLGDGRQRYVPGVNETSDLNDKYERALRDGFVSADRAVNMLVIKTFPGIKKTKTGVYFLPLMQTEDTCPSSSTQMTGIFHSTPSLVLTTADVSKSLPLCGSSRQMI